MSKLILAVLFAAACGGPTAAPAAPAAPAAATPPAATTPGAVFAIKDMMFFENNDPAVHLTKDGHIEVRAKHVHDGGATTVDNQFVGVLAADGTVSDPSGTKRGQLSADGTFTSPEGAAPFKLDNDTLVAEGAKITIDDHGAVLKDGKPISPPFRVEGATDATSRRTALFVVALLFSSGAVEATPPTATQAPSMH